MLRFVAAAVTFVCLSVGAYLPFGGNPAEAQEKFQLKVALYPWIPDQVRFAEWIANDFNRRYASIDLGDRYRGIELIVRPMKLREDRGLSYDPTLAAAALLNPQSDDHQHLIEIDTMTLGALVRAGAVSEFSIDRSDYFPFAQKAVTIDGSVYGVPHWTCGYFIMSTHRSVVKAKSAADLRRRLDALGTPSPNLGGPIEGSWDTVVVYLDAYLDTYPDGTAADALNDAGLDGRVLSALKEIGAACTADGRHLCEGKTGRKVLGDFGTGDLDALIGYSEKLSWALRGDDATVKPDDVYIGPAPLGDGEFARNFLFTDALVKSPRCDSRPCEKAADIFAKYYVSDEVLAAAMMSVDGGEGAIPRYLLPATEGAFNVDRVKDDPIYRQLLPLMPTAVGYPHTGVPEARGKGLIRLRVNEAMGQCPGLSC